MKKRHLLLTLLMALCVPWAANAQQNLADYTFSTGTDASKWVTLDNPTTILSTSVGSGTADSKYSDLTDIGFNFPFDESTYTKFSVNSDGNLRLGNTVTGTSNYATPFGKPYSWSSTSNADVNNPKINAFGCDGYLNSNNYVKTQLVASGHLVVEFSLITYSQNSNDYQYKWQIHLYSTGDIEIVFPAASEIPETLPSATHQCGLCVDSSDGWVITSSNNEAEHFTNSSSTTNESGTWFDANRYYRFERPVVAYPKPTNLHVTGTDHQSASLAWTAPEAGPNTLTGYAYEYKPASQTDWDNNWTTLNNASATTLTVPGLATSTSYNFRMKALYGSNGSEEVTVDFSTTAVATAVGDSWSDDFEGAECGWNLINGTQPNQWVWGTAVNNGGTHALYVSNDDGNTHAYTQSVSSVTIVFATKLLNFTDGKFEFAYDWMAKGEDNGTIYDYLRVALVPTNETLTAGTMPSGFSSTALPSTWINLDGGALRMQDSWQAGGRAANVAAGNYYLVFIWRNDTSGGANPPAAIDNVTITKMACPYDVTNLTAPTIGSTSAILTWNGGGASQWIVSYSANSNFQNATEVTVREETYTMPSLTPTTDYYVKVRAYCGGSDYGGWSDVYHFVTECPANYPLDYTCGFEGPNGTGSYVMPLCWTRMGSYTTQQPYVTTGANHGEGGSRSLYFYKGSSTSYQNEIAALPAIDANLKDVRVVFYGKLSSASADGTINVGYVTDLEDATTFQLVETVTLSTSWEKNIVSLGGVGNATGWIAFQSYYNNINSATASIYIDDVLVEAIPSCLEPSDLDVVANSITTNSVQLTWTPGGTETAWDIYCTTSTEAPTDATTPTVAGTTNPCTVNGLTGSSHYYAYVRARCSGSDQSGWSIAKEFDTKCEAITTFPINYGFETSEGFPSNASAPTTNQLGACWRNEATVQNGTYADRVWGTSTYYKHTGSQALVLPDKGNSTNFAKTMLVFPEMEFTYADGYIVSFWIYRSGTSSNPEGFKLYVSDCDTIGPNAVELGHYSRNYGIAYPDIVTSGWYQYETAPITRTGSVYLIFEGQSYYGSATYVDDITIKEYVTVTADQIVETVSDPATEMTWNEFAQHVNNGDHFTSSTFTLMNDITVSTMVGNSDKPFTGTFNGNSHTITVNLTATDANFTAPFRVIKNATIQNLKVNGTINDGGFKFCAGFAGDCYGNNTFTNCESAVTINATIEGDGTHGGFIARNYGGSYSSSSDLCTTVFNGCAFTGQLLGASTTQVGGFCGWSEYQSPNYAKTIFNSCLFAPQAVTMSTTNSAVFARRRNASYVNFNNCYFMQDFNDGTNNTAQGKQAYTIAGVDPVYVLMSGEHTLYNMSGIDAYTVGMIHGYIKLAGEGDNVTLALSGAPGYEANHGTLTATGETYNLLMEAFNTEISAVDCPVPFNVAASDITATSAKIAWEGNGDSYTLQHREVITAAVDVNDTYGFEDNTLQGWTTISNDNDNNAWSVFNGSSYAHEGSYYVRSRYTSSTDGGDANDWLISPQISLGGTFSFYAKRYGTTYTDQFQVYISTTGNNISDFTAISEVITPNSTYDLYEYDLSSYSGYGYVAIVYTAPNNQYYVYVDDITYTNHIDGEYGEWLTVSDAASPQPIDNLTPETTYQVQVSGNCSGVETDYSDIIEFTTPATCPAPTSLAVTENSVTAHGATLTWTENGEADTWIVEYADNADFTDASTETVEDNATYTFDLLDGETTYYVRVKAHCDAEDESYYSNVVNFTTLVACQAPTGLTVTEITTTTAKLSWTENGTATAWQICLNGDEEHLIAADSNPFVLDEGLTAATSYTVKVRANCGGIDGQSGWSNTVSFKTECEVIDALGYSEDFDSFEVASTYTAPSTRVLPNCWSAINTTTDYGYDAFPSIYYYEYTNYANSTPNCLKFYSYYYYDDWYDYEYNDPQPQYAILPEMRGLAGTQVTLQARGYNTSSTFKIGTMSDPADASTFTMIKEQTGLTTSYQEFEYLIPADCQDSYLAIMIDAANSSREYNGVYIDDIVIAAAPTCLKPTDLECTATTTTTATFSWTNGAADQTAWQICLNGDETNLIMADSNPFTLEEGLTASTSYTVKVRAYCDDDDQSDWSNEVSFATECEPYTITADAPYTQDFENPVVTTTYNQIGEMPVCWDNYPVDVKASAKILTEDDDYNYAESGQVLYFYGSGYNYAALPEFTNALNTLQISFKYATESDSNGTLTLGYITDEDENYSSFTAIEGGTFAASSASEETFVDVDPIDLSALPANATRLVFRWYYDSWYGCNVDDVEVSLLPPTTLTQTIELAAGTNWVSFNVDITLNDLKAAIQAALPGTTATAIIASKQANVRYMRGRWAGQLNALDPTQMYKITVSDACEIVLEGMPVDPTELVVTIVPGANWIAYPFATSSTPTNFFSGFAINNDQVSSKTQSSRYRGRWAGQLNTLEPGQGYIYFSAGAEDRLFSYPTLSKDGDKAILNLRKQ